MNEHDSERMKGMLESLGYAEAAERDGGRPHPVQHLLDPREGRRALRRPPASRPRASSARRPDTRDRRRRLLGPVGQGGGVRPLPVRRRGVRTRPGAPARRVPRRRLADRAGLLRVRGLHRPSAGQARPRVPGLGADQRRLQLRLLVLHRPLDPRPRGEPRRRASSSTRSGALAADGVREVTLLGQNVNSYGRDLPARARHLRASCSASSMRVAGIDRIRYTSPHPKDMREDVIRAHAELPSLCEHIHLPLQSGSSAGAQADAPDLHAGALPRPCRADPRARARLRAHARTSSSASPARPRRTSSRPSGLPRQVGYDGAFTFIYSPRRGTEAATLPDQIPHEVKVDAPGAAGRGRPAPRRGARRSASSAARSRCSSRGPRALTQARLRGRSRHNKVVNFDGARRRRASSSTSRSPARPARR